MLMCFIYPQVRAALEDMYEKRVEQEVQRRLAESSGIVTEATKVTDLLERLFSDRPKVHKSKMTDRVVCSSFTTKGQETSLDCNF